MNYSKLSHVYIKQLKNLLEIFYNISDNTHKISILENGTLFVTKKQNIFIRLFSKRTPIIKRNIFDILINDFTIIMSLITSGNRGFSSLFEEDVTKLLYSYRTSNELTKIETIISYYTSKIKDIDIISYWSRDSIVNLEEFQNETYFPDQDNDLYIQNDNVNEKEEGLTYILDTFLWGLRKKISKKSIISYILMITLRISPINRFNYDLKNIIKNLKVLTGFYSSKSPPYRVLPHISVWNYNY